jgi:hypothetical protein
MVFSNLANDSGSVNAVYFGSCPNSKCESTNIVKIVSNPICYFGSSALTMSNCFVKDNQGSVLFQVYSTSTLIVTNCLIEHVGITTSAGGGTFVTNGTVDQQFGQFDENCFESTPFSLEQLNSAFLFQ